MKHAPVQVHKVFAHVEGVPSQRLFAVPAGAGLAGGGMSRNACQHPTAFDADSAPGPGERAGQHNAMQVLEKKRTPPAHSRQYSGA